jgi:hypothetical protein
VGLLFANGEVVDFQVQLAGHTLHTVWQRRQPQTQPARS